MTGAVALTGPAAKLVRGQAAARVIVPHKTWDCGMPDGIPNPESGTLIFEAEMKLDRLASIGKTPYGDRRVTVGLEGKVTGPRLSATVMTGALDFELTLSNGAVEVEDIMVFKTDDGKYIYSRSAEAPAQRMSASRWTSRPRTEARPNG